MSYVVQKSSESGAVIRLLNSIQKAKAATQINTATLETEVEKIIKTQVKRFKMTIDSK